MWKNTERVKVLLSFKRNNRTGESTQIYKKINDNAADDVLFFCRISQPYLNFFFFPPALNNNTHTQTQKHGTQIVLRSASDGKS